jgi:hypothetical protein
LAGQILVIDFFLYMLRKSRRTGFAYPMDITHCIINDDNFGTAGSRLVSRLAFVTHGWTLIDIVIKKKDRLRLGLKIK